MLRRTQPLRLLGRACVILPTLMGAILLAPPARADGGYMVESFLGAGDGLEGGNAGTDHVGWQLARLRLNVGVDLRNEEDAVEGVGFRGFAELQRRGSIGAEVRYSRWLGRGFGAYVGVTGTFAPETLVGATAGATLLLPLGKKGGLFAEPSFSALPLGGDLPDHSVLFWALLTLGINVRL